MNAGWQTTKPMTRRTVAGQAVLLAGAGTLAACGGPQGSRTAGTTPQLEAATLRWATDYEATFHPLVDAALARLKQQAPQLTVQHEATPGAEYYTKLRTLLASDTMPDVALMTTRWSAQWLRGRGPALAGGGAFKDLDPLLKREKHDVSDFWPLLMPGFSDETGHVHVFPYDISAQLLYYNKALLQAEGVPVPDGSWTLDRLLEQAKRLTKPASQLYGFVGFPSGGQFEHGVERFGGSLFDEKLQRCALNSAGSVAGVQWWTDLRHRHGVSPSAPDMATLGGAERAFGNGNVAMVVLGTPSVGRVRGFQIDWDVAPIPPGPRGDQLRAGGGGYAISGKTPNPEQSWVLLKHLTSKETLAEMIGRSGRSIPGRKSVAQSTIDAAKPPRNWPAALKEAEKARAISFSLHPRGGDILDEVTRGLNAIYDTGGDVKAQLEALTTRVDALLAQR